VLLKFEASLSEFADNLNARFSELPSGGDESFEAQLALPGVADEDLAYAGPR
jgi:hypothetical protein